MLKNLKLGAKIVGGFVTVLVLLAVVAYVGYNGLSGVVDRVDKGDDVNRMVKGVLEARQDEKNFIIRGEESSVGKVDESVKEIIDQAKITKDKFNQTVNKAQMDQVIREVTGYQEAFHGYVDLAHEKKKTMEEMRSNAREALAQADAIRADQQNQLEKGRVESEAFVSDKMAKADDANRMIKWFIDARKNEKEFIISNGEKNWKDNVDDRVAKILELSADLKSRFKQAQNIEQIDKVVGQIKEYGAGFDKFADLMQQKKGAMTDMRANARKALAQAEAIRADQKAQLARGRKTMDLGSAQFTAFLDDKMGKADDANRLIKWFIEVRKNEKEFVITNGDQEWMDKHQGLMAKILELSADLKSRFKQAQNIKQIDNAVAGLKAYNAGFSEFARLIKQEGGAMEKMRANAREALAQCDAIREDQKAQLAKAREESSAFLDDKMAKADDANRMIKWFIDARKNEKEFIISGEQKWWDNVDDRVAKILKLSGDLRSRFKLAQNIEQVDKLIAGVKGYDAAFDKFGGLTQEQNDGEKVMVAAAREADKVCTAARADQKAKMEGQISTANSIMLGGAAVAIILGSLLAFFITRGITKPINRIIEGLSEGADQVASASGQVSSSSQSLAEGSSEQASSLEETSSSLEEMASMTKQNADSANQANTLMEQANQVIGKANSSMGDLTTSMEDISKASEETSKIIKTIDEIAFQTNLLALNAAVEAARAGEAGAGFAVVADEVRNLALRAADAAKNTADLIEGTVKKVKDGGDLVGSTNEAFSEVATSSSKVGELVGEIAAASNEQAQGIENVNTAIAEMDKITQSNAANAEESASASEEMNAQAEQMKGVVGELIALVGGSAAKAEERQYAERGEVKTVEKKAATEVHKALAAPAKKARKKQAAAQQKKTVKKEEVKPDEVIPMDEEEGDFKDF